MRRTSRAGLLLFFAMTLGGMLACHKKQHGNGSGSGSASSAGSEDLSPAPPAPAPDTLQFDITLQVVTEGGGAIAGATLAMEATSQTTDAGGFAFIAGLVGPVSIVISKPGFLDEPVVVGRDDAAATVVVPMWALAGPLGERRTSIHMAGDVMLARRYITPTETDTIVVTPGDPASARAVVRHVAPIFGCATLSTANIEAVIGTLPDSASYPGKLFLIESIPEITAMLNELGLDLAVLGNNHMRDWLEPGIASTTSALASASIPWVGAGIDEASSRVPAMLTGTGGLKVAVLSYSNVNGDNSNEFYPLDSVVAPVPIPPGEEFRYEFRTWGFTGATVTIPVASRRIGSAWPLIDGAGSGILGTPEEAALWASATAVYPELQDWVARRGHGGANWFRSSVIGPDIAAVRLAGAEIVIVQIHSGPSNYAEFKSDAQESAFRAAIDAGADIAVGHHPHVLQGIEMYKGKPIVYSLGNFVFDQNILPTFASGILRVVFEEARLLECRIIPITIHRYVPIPVAGNSARDVTRIIHERSEIDATSRRYGEVVAATLLPDAPGEGSTLVRHNRSSAVISEGTPVSFTDDLEIADDSVTAVSGIALSRSRAPGGTPLSGVRFGRDLFRWGHFEDEAADNASLGGFQWHFNADEFAWKRVEFEEDGDSFRLAYMHRSHKNSTRTRVRPVARVQTLAHRLFVDSGGFPTPADGAASWSIAMRARISGDGPVTLILDVSHFDSSIPNEEPVDDFLRSVEIPIDLNRDGDWHDVLLDIPSGTWDAVDGKEANQALFYLALYPPGDGKSEIYFDNVKFIEWRDAAALPDFFYLVDVLRSSSGSSGVTLERRGE